MLIVSGFYVAVSGGLKFMPVPGIHIGLQPTPTSARVAGAAEALRALLIHSVSCLSIMIQA